MIKDIEKTIVAIEKYYLGAVTLQELDNIIGVITLDDLVDICYSSGNILELRYYTIFVRAISKQRSELKFWLLTPELLCVYCFNLSREECKQRLEELLL